MPNIFYLPLAPVEVKRIVKDKSGDITEGLLELAEADGTVRRYNITVGKDGATEIAFAVEATGEQKMSLYGKNPSNALAAVRTDANRMLRMRGFEPWRFEDAYEPTPGAAYSTRLTVPSSTLALIEVTVVSTANTPAIDVHLVASGGSPTTANSIFIGADPGVGKIPFRDGPHQLEAGGTVQVRNTAAPSNLGNVRLWVEYYSVGDSV